MHFVQTVEYALDGFERVVDKHRYLLSSVVVYSLAGRCVFHDCGFLAILLRRGFRVAKVGHPAYPADLVRSCPGVLLGLVGFEVED